MTEASNTRHQDLLPVSIEAEMKKSYLDYAMSVIVSRAIPDVRDGLKPVHRRILYGMLELGCEYNKPYKKSARIVGDVMGKFHPHGDSAIYDSLVRMAQPFSMRLMLVDGQGNFGSMDGDAPAAMRYTESRLSKAAHALLADIDNDTVNWQENYDGSEQEPVVLPAAFPNILVNGAGGIAVGMATNIPPHNLGEVVDACMMVLDNPEVTIEEMIEVCPGPDFPTGGIILGRAGARSGLMTGRGSVIMRGKTEIEEIRPGRWAIIVSEVPYQVNKAKLLERIAELVREKKIEGISDLRDESDKSGVRVVIEVKKDAMPDVVLNQLYSFTPLQTSFGVNMLALDNGRPELMNLKQIITSFIRFREEVITRRTNFLLGKARDRAHVLVGLAIAVANIDEVIRVIRSSRTQAEAKARLAAARHRKPFKQVVNSALRLGLDELLKPAAAKPYRTKPRPLGLRDELNGVAESAVLALVELDQVVRARDAPLDHRIALGVGAQLDAIAGLFHEPRDAGRVGGVEHPAAHALGGEAPVLDDRCGDFPVLDFEGAHLRCGQVALGLADRAGERVEKLSGGLARRVELAQGLLHSPPILMVCLFLNQEIVSMICSVDCAVIGRPHCGQCCRPTRANNTRR